MAVSAVAVASKVFAFWSPSASACANVRVTVAVSFHCSLAILNASAACAPPMRSARNWPPRFCICESIPEGAKLTSATFFAAAYRSAVDFVVSLTASVVSFCRVRQKYTAAATAVRPAIAMPIGPVIAVHAAPAANCRNA